MKGGIRREFVRVDLSFLTGFHVVGNMFRVKPHNSLLLAPFGGIGPGD